MAMNGLEDGVLPAGDRLAPASECDSLVYEQRRMSVDSGGMAPPFGRHDPKVVDRLMELGPLPVPEMLLCRQHQARAPAFRGYPPRGRSKERFIKGPVERPDFVWGSGRLRDRVEPLSKLVCYPLGRWSSQDVSEP